MAVVGEVAGWPAERLLDAVGEIGVAAIEDFGDHAVIAGRCWLEIEETDEVNFASLGGTRFATGTFLTPNRAFNPRQVQLGLRLEF